MIIIFCVGTGANGKSIFGNVVSAIMGQYSTAAPSSILAARRVDDHSARSDLAMLHGARIVSINELPGGMMLDENVAKQLAGREPISARFLYKEHFTFLPRFTPWVRTNHRPIIKGTDNGIWRRLVIVPFRRTFAPEAQDNGLETKLSIPEQNWPSSRSKIGQFGRGLAAPLRACSPDS
jgi:putative DNA primase/helicase